MTDDPTAPRKKSRALKTWSKRNVPDHFWPEIFPYLPVKSLLRFRSVSNYWRAAIDSPDFARLHLTRFPNNRLQSRLFVVQVTRRKPECATRCSKTLRSTAKLGFFKTDIPASHVVGSIDGLFMLKNSISSTGEQELLLWNPSIRKTRIVHPPSPQQPSSERDNVVEFGLGFDPLIEDYKYVSFVQVNGYGTGLRFIEVYSIGTNSWKTIEFQGDGYSSWPERFMMNHLQRAVCLRGVLYGLAHESISLVKAYDLVSFDLNREVFASAGLPGGNYQESGLYCQTLAMMDGGCSLAVVNVSSDNGCLWLPERLGDGIGSWRWSRRYVFATAFPDYDAFGWTAVKFLHLKKNDDDDGDELLLKVHNVVISYNLETHQYKTVLKKNLHEGYCRRKGEQLLVYEYMPNGSLDKLLFDKEKPAISWLQRLKIIKVVASALFYEEWEQIVLHRDVKVSNILLDAYMDARLGDFGLARLYDHGTNPQTTHVVGTVGYLAPELPKTGKATTRTDVYSFGTFILEAACGRRPIENEYSPEEVILVDWVHECWMKGVILKASDPRLEGNYGAEKTTRILKLGLLCSHLSPEARLSIIKAMKFLDGDPKLPELPQEFAEISSFYQSSETSSSWFPDKTFSSHSHSTTVPIV